MIERQVLTRPAILALKTITQEQVEPREGGIFIGLHILTQRNDAGDLHLHRGAMHFTLIAFDDINAVEKDRLDRRLPRPKAERIVTERRIIRVQHQRGAAVRMPDQIGMVHSSLHSPLAHVPLA